MFGEPENLKEEGELLEKLVKDVADSKEDKQLKENLEKLKKIVVVNGIQVSAEFLF